METYLALTTPANPEHGYGYQNPTSWQRWHDTLVDSGDLEAPLPDLTAACTNEFVEVWKAE